MDDRVFRLEINHVLNNSNSSRTDIYIFKNLNKAIEFLKIGHYPWCPDQKILPQGTLVNKCDICSINNLDIDLPFYQSDYRKGHYNLIQEIITTEGILARITLYPFF